jgi:predicted esterase
VDIALNWENNVPLAGVIAVSDSVADEAVQECKEKAKSICTAKVLAPMFITHGTDDDTVPINKAREKVLIIINLPVAKKAH